MTDQALVLRGFLEETWALADLYKEGMLTNLQIPQIWLDTATN